MKTFGLALLGVVAVLMAATPVFAQPVVPANPTSLTTVSLGSSAIGAGLVIIGAAFGFGRIGGSALESMARQPEAAGRIQPAMIIIAALLEGATFFALLVCLLQR